VTVPDKSTLRLLLATNDDSLATELRGAGMDVTQTPDGFDTIRLAMELRPDAVVLDKTTSGLPVPTVGVWLKLHPLTHLLPTIGLSGDMNGWQEAELDASVNRSEAVERLADITSNLVEATSKQQELQDLPDLPDFDPLSITLDLIEIYRERLGLASAMIRLASLQHDLGDFGYTIKSTLEAAGQALLSPLVGIILLRERSHYVLVRQGGLTKTDVHQFEQFSLEQLAFYGDKHFEIEDQYVFGRRRLTWTTDPPSITHKFFGHPIYSRGRLIGFLGGMEPEDEGQKVFYAGLLPDLTAQIALLLVNVDLLSAHDSYVEELASILRAAIETSSISPLSDTSSRSFLLQFLLIVLELCHTDRGCVVLLDDERGSVSEVAALGCEESEIISAHLRRGRTVAEEIPYLNSGEVIADTVYYVNGKCNRLVTPLTAGDKVIGALVMLDYLSKLSPRMIEALKTLSSLAGYFLYNRWLHQKSIRSSIIEDQLKIARETQAEMLPEEHPAIPKYDIFGRSVPAREVGGDFFDYLSRDRSTFIAIADVCGKSIPASLLMTMTRALFVAGCEHFEDPDRVLRDVNSHLAQRIGRGQFVTASLLQIAPGEVSYASAGHQPLLVYRAEKNDFEEIDADGIALGIVPSVDFERVTVDLNPGDIALMYTDGLNEAMNPDRVQFGYGNVRAVVRENANRSAMEIVYALFDAIAQHAEGTDQFDDTTIVAIKKKPREDRDNAAGEDKIKDAREDRES
jgi:serine phosphatase RsbU (regulator of sigma subunit)